MNLAAYIVFIPTLIAEICLAELIIQTSKPDESLIEASIDILESCYMNRFGAVGLAGASIRSVIEKISSKKTVIPVILINETAKASSHNSVDRASRHKLQIFVITTTDPNTVVKTVTEVRNTKWWNHMASVLLIDLSGAEYGCSNAYEMLWKAWEMNLLNSKLMCLHETRGTLIYTFNPYVSKAPMSWQRENIYKGINGHDWTLFVREYHEDESRCGDLDFDKTSDVGGYEIRASVFGSGNWLFWDPKRKPTIADRVRNITAQILIRSLNATWSMLRFSKARQKGNPETGEPPNATSMVISGTSDLCLSILIQQSWINHETTYPHYETSLSVITQYRGYESQLEKIISVLDRRARFCVFVVLMTMPLFFICLLRKPAVLAVLDLVLIVCNAGLQKLSDKLAPRIYIGSVFVFMVTIQGIYQGKLLSRLTKQVFLPNINSIDDLARSDHVIYGPNTYSSFFGASTFKGRFIQIPTHNCTHRVLRESKAACVDAMVRLTDDAVNFKLHLSRESMGLIYGVYLVRQDWPLEERVNVIYQRAAAGGIAIPLYNRELNSQLNTLQSYENQEEDETTKVLTMGHLSFAFVILGIGLGCASVIFIIEVAVFDRAIKNPRKPYSKAHRINGIGR